ncbi:MAG: wax ester/triacylglycerol synthase family O-acyltransferase [Acidimicrobiia bacterium]|nr:wax ester/triacylglycerol synthase family O-acyltransferase [Acidimicrobiia bacterium]
MHQLTGLDNSFLQLEGPTTYGHVASLAVFDPATAPHPVGYHEIRALVEARLHLVPPFRRRLVEVPLGLDHPYWIEDPDFDLDFHLRHIAVPPPGDKGQLAELAGRIAARHLDRSRPLWEMYVIEGLEGGLIAQLTKIHHACVDGVAGAEILGVLLDIEPEPVPTPAPAEPWQWEREPSSGEMMARGMLGAVTRPRVGMRIARQTVPALGSIMRNFALKAPGVKHRDDVLSRPTVQAPKTAFNGVITPHRRFAFGSLPLSTVKTVKNATGATVNDVVMSLCAGALRRWLVEHDALPDLPLLAMVPVSIRDDREMAAGGNRISAMVAVLPTDEPDAGRRLQAMKGEMGVAKQEHGAVPASLLQDFAQFTPPSVLGVAGRVITRSRLMDRVNLPFNVIISNVPGPQFPLYVSGARMEGIYPISTIVDGVGLNMTMMSYNGNLDFGLVADREMVPDLWSLIGYLGEELETLEKLATSELPTE